MKPYGEMIHTAELNVCGESFHVEIYCKNDGKHYAKTFLSDTDIIINDGDSLDDVMKVSSDLLPLAVNAHRYREIMRKLSDAQ